MIREDEELRRFLQSIEAQETGGHADPATAVNPRTGAHGRFQILPRNWPAWSKEVFGREVEPTSANQERVALHKMNEYVEQFGPEGAAVAWYAGPTRARQWLENPNDSWFDQRHGGGNEPSVREYVQSVMGRTQPEQTGPSDEEIAAFLGEQGPQPFQAPQIQFPTREQVEGAPPLSTPYEPTPRQLGRMRAEEMHPIERRMEAASQGVGTGMFGIGTPLTAAREIIHSRLQPSREPVPVWDALEYARGMRQEVAEQHPGYYYPGMVGGIGVSTVAAPKAAPARLRSVFALQQGQTMKNLGRMAAIGAAAGGVTGGMEEGVEGAVAGTALGGAAGPAMAGVVRGVQGGFRQLVGNRVWVDKMLGRAGVSEAARRRLGVDPDGPVIRKLAKYHKQSPEATREWVERFKEAFPGQPVRMADALDPRTAEEIAAIAQTRVGARMGGIFREGREEVLQARPGQLREAVERGGPVTTVTAQEELLEPLAHQARGALTGSRVTAVAAREGLEPIQREAAGALVGPRATTVAAREGLEPIQRQAASAVGRRTGRTAEQIRETAHVRLDKFFDDHGDQMVPLTDEMYEFISKPEVWNRMPDAFKYRVGPALEKARDFGRAELSVRDMDSFRKALSDAADAGGKFDFRRLSNRVVEYLSDKVPGYKRAWGRYLERGQMATGGEVGEKILTMSNRKFASALRSIGGGTEDVARSPKGRRMGQAAARMTARNTLAGALEGDPARAAKVMERIARDKEFRKNVLDVLSPAEASELQALARQYGHQLDVVTHVAGGRAAVLKGDSESLALLESLARTDPQSAGAGVRGALLDAFGDSRSADRMLTRLAREDSYREGVLKALTQREASQLQDLARQYGHQLDLVGSITGGRAAVLKGDSESLALLESLTRTEPGGAGAGVRGALRDALGSEQSASRMMTKLAQDEPYRQTLIQALSPTERRMLENVARQYGVQLDMVGAARAGARVLPEGTDVAFRDAVRAAAKTPGTEEAAEQAARGAIASKVGESPEVAWQMGTALGRHEGLGRRILAAFGGEEAARLTGVGEAAHRSARAWDALAPMTPEASARMAQIASDIQTLIGAGVIFGTGRASAAMQASTGAQIFTRLRMTKGTATKMAEMLTDPNRVDYAIKRLIDLGMSPGEIHQMYLRAAASAGIAVGGGM